MSPIDQPAIPKGSTVLITGSNGFIGSNIADQFLKLGYKVRGTTRNPAKNTWVTKLFDAKYGPGNFDFVTVEEMAVDGAFDEAMKGKYLMLTSYYTFYLSFQQPVSTLEMPIELILILQVSLPLCTRQQTTQ